MSKPGQGQQSWGDGMFKFAKRRRQPRWVRVVVAVLVVGCIYLISINAFSPQRSILPITTPDTRDSTAAAPLTNDDGTPLLSASRPRKGKQAPLADGERTSGQGTTKSNKNKNKDKIKDQNKGATQKQNDESVEKFFRKKGPIPDDDEEDVPYTAPGKEEEEKEQDDTPETKETWMQKLESDLKHIFSIAPDELHVRELLRPIENSGKERLREIGLRARAFRTLFEAWEDVHLVHSKNTTLIRDDVIHYLTKTRDLRGIDSHKPKAEIIRSYESFRYFLTKLSALLFPWTSPYFADHMTLHASVRHGGRGIVLSGGDGQLSYLLTSARTIRKLGCNLPIEVMYLGDDDLGDDSRSELEMVPGVITRDMKQMVHDEGWDLKGWAGKPFAILLSSFREIIFIDADAQFFKSPEVLFADESYEETGALFFRDRLMFPESKRKWLQQILPKPMSRRVRKSRFWTGESGHMQESGVIVVDKWRHFMALLMVTRMNGPDRDGDKDRGIVGTYDMVYGDKETFWLGWELVGDSDYAFHPGDAGNMGVAKPKTEEYELERKRKEEDEKRKEEEEEKENKRREEERSITLRQQEELFKRIEEARVKEAEEIRKKGEAEARRIVEQQQAEHAKALAETAVPSEGKDTPKEEQKETPQEEPKEEVKETLNEALGAPSTEAPKEAEQAAEAAEKPPLPDIGNLVAQMEEANAAKAAAEGRDKRDEPITPPDTEAPKLRKRTDVGYEPDTNANADDDDEDILPSLDQERTNYTICAPQLLHLGRDGRPLWFNGWILDNKFDAEHASLSKFEHFMREKRVGSKVADWRLESNNMCCLENDRLYEFNDAEKTVIKNIFAIATEIGVLDKKT